MTDDEANRREAEKRELERLRYLERVYLAACALDRAVMKHPFRAKHDTDEWVVGNAFDALRQALQS